jgi:hypothetical protein
MEENLGELYTLEEMEEKFQQQIEVGTNHDKFHK